MQCAVNAFCVGFEERSVGEIIFNFVNICLLWGYVSIIFGRKSSFLNIFKIEFFRLCLVNLEYHL